MSKNATRRKPVAITGIGCRLPKVHSPAQLWRSLCAAENNIDEVPADRYDSDAVFASDPGTPGKLYTTTAGLVDDPARFDASFFGVSGREAEKLDPQARIMLHVTWEALQDAGLCPEDLRGSDTGVYVGSLYSEYERAFLLDPERYDVYAWAGSTMRSGLAGRVSSAFDLRGPSILVDTACSSSLVALHLACRALQTSDCSLAIAGGCNLLVDPVYTMGYSSASMLAPDGRAKPFCRDADGTARSDGVAVVVLKLLEDAIADGDDIYAVVQGGAVNHDGASSPYMQPSQEAQQDLLSRAMKDAGVEPGQIQYLEAHGTGTKVGDPIELGSIAGALCDGRDRDDPLLVGSVKGNIGHTEGAAGIAGVIKVALALRHRRLPPSVHASPVTQAFPWDRWPLRVCTELRDWPRPDAELVAGVNGFGVTGINAHIILGEGPATGPSIGPKTDEASSRPHLLTVSGHSEDSLRAAIANFASHPFAPEEDLEDICRSAAGRAVHRSHRLAAVIRSKDEIAAVLSEHLADPEGSSLETGVAADGGRRLVFVFSGQGSQSLGMGLELLATEPVFAAAIERWDELSGQYLDWSILDQLRAVQETSRLDEIEVIQPMLAAMQYALATLWKSWGIEPDAVVGHSLGEVTAAQAAGAIRLEDAVRITCQRSKVLRTAVGRGSMIATELTFEEAQEYVDRHPDRLSVACSNSPRSTVLSGETALLDEIFAELEGKSAFVRRVKVDVPAHSTLLEPLRVACLDAIGIVDADPVKLPFYSSVEPAAATATMDLDHDYWWRNMRNPVLFSQAVGRLVDDGYDTFIEVSPHPVLTVPVQQGLRHAGREGQVLPSLKRGQAERASMLASLGRLFCTGATCDWDAVFPGATRSVRLPPYGFGGERYWHAAGSEVAIAKSGRTRPQHPRLQAAYHSAAVPRVRHHDLVVDLASQPFLADHRVGGQAVFPAAGYVEAVLAAAVDGSGSPSPEDRAFRLRDVEFTRAMVISEKVEQTAQLVVRSRGAGHGFAFEIHSRRAGASPDDPWTTHCQGSVQKAAPGDVPGWPTLPRPGGSEIDPSTLYAAVQQRDVHYGPAFRAVEIAWRSESGEVLARLGDGLGVADLHLDPTLLDGALQTLFLALPQGAVAEADRLLPSRVDEIHVVPGRRPRWVRTSVARVDDSTASADMWLYDDAGRPSVMMRGVEFRRSERANVLTGLIHSQRWRPLDDRRSAPSVPVPNRWLVAGDEGGVARAWVGRWFAAHPDHRCVLLTTTPGGDPGLDNVECRVGSVRDDVHGVVSRWAASRCGQLCGPGDSLGVLHLSALDSRLDVTSEFAADDLAERMAGLRDAHIGGMIQLVRSLDAHSASLPPERRTWVVTRDAMAVTDSQSGVQPGQAGMWGFAPSLHAEHPELHVTLVDLDGSESTGQCADRLSEVITTPAAGEDRVALRAGERWVPRLQHGVDDGPAVSAQATGVDHATPFCAAMPQPGVLERLQLRGARRRAPRPGEVEIHVHASGLNFHDVFVAMGILAPDHGDLEESLGLECAGVVTAVGEGVTHLRPGQAVVAVARGCFGSYAVTDAHLACPKPESLAFVEAATIPIAFLTAQYALNEHARIERGESVLIHAGSGGVGFAAIQLAQRAGARILSTASEAKHDYVRGLGVEEVFDSRSLEFRDDVLAVTGGRGVDVVLNSLAGEFLRRSLEVLAPYGRFVEIGKADLVSNGQLGLGHFEDNRSFVAIDIAKRCQDRPREVGRRLADLVALFDSGELRVPPVERFRLDEVAGAFAHMAEGKHRGKIVLTADAAANQVHLGPTRTAIRGDDTYVILGGGGIGEALTDWLLSRGARHVAVIRRSRQSVPDRDGRVRAWQGDVTDAAQLDAIFGQIRLEMPPIAGVVHTAGSTDDATIVSMTDAQMGSVCRAKMEGLCNLRRAVGDRVHDLDFVVLCSSATWFLGSHGQANYGVANAFVEATAQAWRRDGIPATAVHFGPWSEVGIIARAGAELAGRLVDRGFAPMTPGRAVAAFEDILCRDVTSAAVMDFEAEKWLTGPRVAEGRGFFADVIGDTGSESTEGAEPSGDVLDLLGGDDPLAALTGFLVEQLRRCLRLPASQAPDPAVPIRRLGLDSLMALELSLRIEEAIHQPVAAGLLLEEGMSIARLAGILTDSLPSSGSPRPEPVVEVAPPQPDSEHVPQSPAGVRSTVRQ